MRRAERTAKQIALACVALAALLGGYALIGQSPKSATTATIASAHRRPRVKAIPTLPRVAPPSSAIARVRSALSAALRPDGHRTGAIVEDLSDNAVLYSSRANVSRAPASLEKLYTSVAALDLLGPDAQVNTTIYGAGHLSAGGVWDGDLYLHGGGDPTFGDGTWNQAYMGGYGPTATQLVTQLRKAGIRKVSGWVYGDESLFDSDRGGPATHNRPDIPDYGGQLSALVYDHGMTGPGMSPPVFATHELVLTMRAQGIAARFARHTQVTPNGATPLAVVSSPPLSELLRLMNVPSDDLIADLLAKQLGARFFGRGTLAAGAIEIRQALAARYRLEPQIFDGSGLDRKDSTTPAQLVSLLAQVWDTPIGVVLHASLPVVGKQGTVEGIGLGTYAAGHCVAKTGTLNNVTNLAGYCTTRSGQTVAFALMTDGPANAVAVGTLSAAVSAIASYR